MKKMILIFTLLFMTYAQAETTGSVFEKKQVITKTEDGKTSSSELSYVSLYFEASKENNGFKLIGMVDEFEKISLEDSRAVKGQRVRQFLLQKVFGNKTLQVGVLGASPTIGGKTSGSEAVINGGRAIIKQEKGEIFVTVGTMAPLRSGKSPLSGEQTTYIEVKVSRQVLNNLKAEGSFESIGDKAYVRGVGMLDLALASERIMTIVTDVLVEADTGRYMASAGVKFDPFEIFFKRDSRVDVSLGYVHIAKGFEASRRGLIAPSNMNSSDYITFNLNFTLNKKKTGFLFFEASYAPKTAESFLGFGFRFKF